MAQAFLSNTELYYAPPQNITGNLVTIQDEEFKHITNVMRHSIGDSLNVTDGTGKIYQCTIKEIEKKKLSAEIDETIAYTNEFANIWVCLPRLKNNDRFEFAMEKCIELGITAFIVFDGHRSVAKGSKLARWQKIAIAAMKQSLRSYLPRIEYMSSLEKLKERDGKYIVFDQESEKSFKDVSIESNSDVYLVFGPEGGLTENELSLFENTEKMCLTPNRLRSETAVITAVSIITAGK